VSNGGATSAATSTPSPSVAPAGLRTIAFSGAYVGRPAALVTLCSFDEDLQSLGNPRVQLDDGAGFHDAGFPPVYLYYALNNQAHYTGRAGFLSFEDPAGALTPGRRYRILAERGGTTIASNVVRVPGGVSTARTPIAEPAGAYDFDTPPQISAPPRAAWGSNDRAILALWRVEPIAPQPGLPGVTTTLAAEAVVEVDATSFAWGGQATETWVTGRSPLPPGRYAMEVMTVDGDGWVTSWSTDRALGADAYYRFDVR
jgi:hypothetical protein